MELTAEQFLVLVERVTRLAPLAESPLHGHEHWRYVAEVGLHIARATPEADEQVILFFALLHDSQRQNENSDPEHGPRAEALIRKLHAEDALPLGEEQLSLLTEACRSHDRGTVSSDPTIGACFDADRLTLSRVGIRPDRAYLSGVARKQGSGFIRYATNLLDTHPAMQWDELWSAYTDLEVPLGRPEPQSDQQEVDRLLDFFGEEELSAELQPYVTDRGGITTLSHPLVVMVMFAPPMHRMANNMLVQKQELLDEAEREGDWAKALVLYERPYRLDAFCQYEELMDNEQYWQLLGQIWTDSENIFQAREQWTELLHSDRPGRSEGLMEEDERQRLCELPDRVEIYRGFCHRDGEKGLSWTLSRERAEWFAHRLRRESDPPPRLVVAEARREDILALFTRRSEDEVVILPEHAHVQEILALGDC